MAIEYPSYKCPVCGNYTLPEGAWGEICPVCFWEADGFVQNDNDISPANGLSIAEARDNWKKMNCSDLYYKQFCRHPYPSELPWIYEHDPEITGQDDRDAMVDLMRSFYYISDEVHSHEKEYFESATAVFHDCLAYTEEADGEGCYDSTERPEEYDMEEMIHIFELLADYGDHVIESNIKLAQCYIHGFGVKKDLAKAAEYLREAAEHAEIKSQEGDNNGEGRLLHE